MVQLASDMSRLTNSNVLVNCHCQDWRRLHSSSLGQRHSVLRKTWRPIQRHIGQTPNTTRC